MVNKSPLSLAGTSEAWPSSTMIDEMMLPKKKGANKIWSMASLPSALDVPGVENILASVPYQTCKAGPIKTNPCVHQKAQKHKNHCFLHTKCLVAV